MKLRSKGSVDGDGGRNADDGMANPNQPDSFEEGEETLINLINNFTGFFMELATTLSNIEMRDRECD